MVLSGVHSFKNQRKKQKRGFPIKNFGNDEREVDASLNFRHEG
jgi:hypothetical protein